LLSIAAAQVYDGSEAGGWKPIPSEVGVLISSSLAHYHFWVIFCSVSTNFVFQSRGADLLFSLGISASLLDSVNDGTSFGKKIFRLSDGMSDGRFFFYSGKCQKAVQQYNREAFASYSEGLWSHLQLSVGLV
jgi:hypothetical protein